MLCQFVISHKFDGESYIRFCFKIKESLKIIYVVLPGEDLDIFSMLSSCQNTMPKYNTWLFQNLQNDFQNSLSYFGAYIAPKTQNNFFSENKTQVYETLFCLIQVLIQRSSRNWRCVLYEYACYMNALKSFFQWYAWSLKCIGNYIYIYIYIYI